MEDSDGTRYYSDADKCKLMEKTWSNIYKITDEEEAKFDRRHSENIDTYINLHNHRTSPYINTDLSRLNVESFYTRPIDRE